MEDLSRPTTTSTQEENEMASSPRADYVLSTGKVTVTLPP